ncbi:MAG: flagellar basal body P-ring protein FlgI [Acidobacteriota bacterium]|nr:flagellar basal body P-ring protein FlgI [Acidobacteriota bacterium]
MIRITGIFFLLLTGFSAQAQVRLKDIASIEGVRPNVLTGFGIVVGLNGTGDKDQTRFTTQALANALAKSGISLAASSIKVKNVALVLVQAELPPFARSGSRIDVTASSTGDAQSLQGGTLLLTELKGLDGQTYALAQGPLSIGGFGAGGGGSSVTVNHLTVGRVPNGAMVEREVTFDFLAEGRVRYILDQSDFTTMDRAVTAINRLLGARYARSLNPRIMEVIIPPEQTADTIAFISRLENLTIRPDTAARIVINERTGTIVIGENVKVDRVAIAHGSLTIQIQTENIAVPSPGAFRPADTVIETNQITTVDQGGDARVMIADEGVSLGSIARTLNALKVSPRDIIAIFQALKEAGAIHAELKLI